MIWTRVNRRTLRKPISVSPLHLYPKWNDPRVNPMPQSCSECCGAEKKAAPAVHTDTVLFIKLPRLLKRILSCCLCTDFSLHFYYKFSIYCTYLNCTKLLLVSSTQLPAGLGFTSVQCTDYDRLTFDIQSTVAPCVMESVQARADVLGTVHITARHHTVIRVITLFSNP
jgi:hypothetical protein